MHGLEDVVYCKQGVVNMFSDASKFQLTGARIEDDGVLWDTRFKVSLSERERDQQHLHGVMRYRGRFAYPGLQAQGEGGALGVRQLVCWSDM